MNPIANTPIFLGLTADDSPELRRRVAVKALVTTFELILAVIGVQTIIDGVAGAIKMAQ